jgi:dipeptidyl aminopeptidase/acylaminoacyl peptidase
MFTMQSFLLLIRRTAAIVFIAIVCAPILVCADSIDTVIDSLFKLRHLSGVSISPDGRQVAWVQTREDAATGGVTYSVYTSGLERPGAPAKRITAGTGTAEYMEHEIVWSPDSKRLAFLSDAEKKGQAQLYVSEISGGRPQRMTNLTGALAKPSWSPDGKTIALLFIENAARGAGPLEAMTAETGVIEQQIYHQRLTTIDVASGKTQQLSPAGLYVYEYDWSSDGRTFVATAAPGPGDNNWYIAQIYTIALRDGKTTSIFKTPMQIANPRWSPDGKSVAFIGGLMSDEGVNGGDIFVIPAAGGEPQDLTPERKASPKWLSWLAPDQIVFMENIDGSIGVSSLDPGNKEVKTLWTEDSALSLSISRDGKMSAAVRESFERPPEVWVGPIGQWRQITQVNKDLRPFWGETKNVHWNNEGFRVQGWLLYPRNYDASANYPMIVFVHGGPAGMLTPHWPATWDYATTAAAAGYFVFFPNPRGSLGQGEAFTRANVKDFGYGDLRDILAGVDEVVKTAPIDTNRVGITGWSYGGYMTMWGLTQTQRFRAAVAGAGIANWQSYYGQNQIDQWMIPYFGASVYDDPQVYARSSPINFIKNVKTPTLILVGERDGECPLPQSYEYWHALKTLGVETQFVVYPNEGHRIARPDHRRDIVRRSIAWFDSHMKAAGSSFND